MDSQLKAVAYGLTGSWADAEEIVQEAHARTLARPNEVDSKNAYLYRVVCNLAHDHLRKEKVRRREYFGPWLPEPVADERLDVVELHQELSLGFLLLLEHLTPGERIVFVLREVFDFSHAELAAMLDVSVAAIRQRYSRAKTRLKKVGEVHSSPSAEVQTLLEGMMEAVLAGDVDGLISLMSDDVVAITDGGGVVSAAIQPVYDPSRIATVIMHLVQKNLQLEDVQISFEGLNGGVSLLILQHAEFHSATTLSIENGKIKAIYVLRNPEKTAGISDKLRQTS